MLEQVTEAIVLDKECIGDAHVRVHLFTKSMGRIIAKATSARKITSKLNAHLEPLNIITVRLVEKNHLPQVTDALRKDKLPFKVLPALMIVKELAAEYEPDAALFTALSAPLKDRQNLRRLLSILGYDPQLAECVGCGKPPAYFSLSMLSFVCEQCFTGGEKYVML